MSCHRVYCQPATWPGRERPRLLLRGHPFRLGLADRLLQRLRLDRPGPRALGQPHEGLTVALGPGQTGGLKPLDRRAQLGPAMGDLLTEQAQACLDRLLPGGG